MFYALLFLLAANLALPTRACHGSCEDAIEWCAQSHPKNQCVCVDCGGDEPGPNHWCWMVKKHGHGHLRGLEQQLEVIEKEEGRQLLSPTGCEGQ